MSFAKTWCLCFFAIFLITGIQCFFQTSLGLLHNSRCPQTKTAPRLVSLSQNTTCHFVQVKLVLEPPTWKHATQNWVHLPQINRNHYFPTSTHVIIFQQLLMVDNPISLIQRKHPQKRNTKTCDALNFAKTCPNPRCSQWDWPIYLQNWVVLVVNVGKCR